jgi:hypothetical protein
MMNNYNWCHGTECHTNPTQDRLRGVKGKKVLRTRKIKTSDWDSPTSSWNWFCSHQCQQDFWQKVWFTDKGNSTSKRAAGNPC